MTSREYPDRPLVGVSALVLHGGRVLLIKRRCEPDKGLWALPGGLVNLGEKVVDAAVREIFEETGIKISIKRLIDVVDKISLDENGKVKYHFVIISFEGEPLSYDIKPSSEVEEAKWVDAEEIVSMELSDKTRELLVKIGFINY